MVFRFRQKDAAHTHAEIAVLVPRADGGRRSDSFESGVKLLVEDVRGSRAVRTPPRLDPFGLDQRSWREADVHR
jgi:hypothetical protein